VSNPFSQFATQARMTRESQVIVDVLNKQLKDKYGVDIVTGLPIFRIVWSDDQRETRHGTFTDYSESGLFLREITETRQDCPKYQWIDKKHLLERLVVVPDVNQEELAGAKTSYEPLWVFETGREEYLPPSLDASCFVIDNVLDAQAINTMMITGSEKIDRRMVRYSDPNNSQEANIDLRKARIQKLYEELSGEDSSLGGETHNASGAAIIVPSNYKETQ